MEQLPKSTDLFTHFLPQYDDIQARLCADLESLEAPLITITRGSSAADPLLQHDLIRDTLSYQLIVSQVRAEPVLLWSGQLRLELISCFSLSKQ